MLADLYFKGMKLIRLSHQLAQVFAPPRGSVLPDEIIVLILQFAHLIRYRRQSYFIRRFIPLSKDRQHGSEDITETD